MYRRVEASRERKIFSCWERTKVRKLKLKKVRFEGESLLVDAAIRSRFFQSPQRGLWSRERRRIRTECWRSEKYPYWIFLESDGKNEKLNVTENTLRKIFVARPCNFKRSKWFRSMRVELWKTLRCPNLAAAFEGRKVSAIGAGHSC